MKKNNLKKILALSGVLIFVALVSLLSLNHVQETVYATDSNFSDGITVDTKDDVADSNVGDGICDDGDGNCTLRAAIQESNTIAGTQTIDFNITGTADFINSGENGYSIKPSSALPDINDTVIIDGYSQPGSQANMAISPNPFNSILLIEIDGVNAGGDFIFGGSNVSGLVINSGSINSEFKGLVINGFSGAGISVRPGADNIKISGNYIGTNSDGTVAKNNYGSGITTNGTGPGIGGPKNVVVGGLNPSDRNIISGNDSHSNDPNLAIGVQGISLVDGSNGWMVQGNYIGTAADGISAIPNELGGMTIDYVDGLTVGGSAVGAANIISGNGDGGVQPDGCSEIVIQGNYIGVDYTGTTALPNGHKGISFVGSTNSIVGGAGSNEGNIIANAANGDPGIFLNSGSSIYGPLGYPQDISILGNSIYNNAGLGIDLNFNGVTLNDANDSDSGSNDLLNFPEYNSVVESGGDTTITYDLDAPAGDYRIEFFSNTSPDGSSYGEGEAYLGYQNITSSGGQQNFTHILVGVTGVTNLSMTTTQRNVATASGFGATSEFSASSHIPKTDLSLTKTLVNPQDVAVGATLTYRLTIKNHGPDTIDLSDFNGSSLGFNNLITDAMSSDITYEGNVSSTNVSCFSAGPGSAVIFGVASANHSDYELVFCSWSGPSYLLANGESFSLTVDVIVQPNSDLVFKNYAILPSIAKNDPDNVSMQQIFTSGSDVFDGLEQNGTINNFSVAVYPLPPEPSQSPATINVQAVLSNTGQGIYLIISLAAVLLVTSLGLVKKSKSQN